MADDTADDTLRALAATIRDRRGATAEASYTKSLLDAGAARCARKFGEESIEAIVAALQSDRDGLRGEAADVVYHLLVLLEAADVAFDDVLMDLRERMRQSGHAEKASRGA